jgi:hypothetical protein
MAIVASTKVPETTSERRKVVTIGGPADQPDHRQRQDQRRVKADLVKSAAAHVGIKDAGHAQAQRGRHSDKNDQPAQIIGQRLAESPVTLKEPDKILEADEIRSRNAIPIGQA